MAMGVESNSKTTKAMKGHTRTRPYKHTRTHKNIKGYTKAYKDIQQQGKKLLIWPLPRGKKASILDSEDYNYKWTGGIQKQMELIKDMQMIKEKQWAYERHFYFIHPNNLKDVLGNHPNFINIMRDPIG